MVKRQFKKRKLEKKKKDEEIPVKPVVIDLSVDDEDEKESDENSVEENCNSDENLGEVEEIEILYSVNPGGDVYILVHCQEPHDTYNESRDNVFESQNTSILGVFSCLKSANIEAYRYLTEKMYIDEDDIDVNDFCGNGWSQKDEDCDPNVLKDHVYVIVQKLR